MIQIRNPSYNIFNTIDCEILHPTEGWLPFTASPEDVEEHGRLIYQEALKLVPTPYSGPSLEELEQQFNAVGVTTG